MSVNFLASKIFRKGLCKALIFKKKFKGCSRELDLMKKGLRQQFVDFLICRCHLENLT